jgi:hypothetical protein
MTDIAPSSVPAWQTWVADHAARRLREKAARREREIYDAAILLAATDGEHGVSSPRELRQYDYLWPFCDWPGGEGGVIIVQRDAPSPEIPLERQTP